MSKFTQDLNRLRSIVADSLSYADVFRSYDIKSVKTSNYSAPSVYYNMLKADCALHNIDISHFNAAGARADALRLNGERKSRSLDDILSNAVACDSTRLKAKLYSVGLKQPKCEVCDLGDMWNDLPITHHLDHIDGNHNNNLIDNLRILCPNCHSQTPTHSRKK